MVRLVPDADGEARRGGLDNATAEQSRAEQSAAPRPQRHTWDAAVTDSKIGAGNRATHGWAWRGVAWRGALDPGSRDVMVGAIR